MIKRREAVLLSMPLLSVVMLGGCDTRSTETSTSTVTSLEQPLQRPSAREDEHEAEGASARRRAQRGFAISPVPIDASRLSRDEWLKVGLGSYIANGTSDCGGCHSGPAGFLAGGNPFKIDAQGHFTFSRNLTSEPATGLRMSLAQFKRVIRTGVDLHVDSTQELIVMPWPIFRWMSDDDLEALYAYLRQVPPVVNPVPVGNKAGLGLPPSTPFPGVYDDGEVVRPLPRRQRSFDLARGLAIAPLAAPRGLRGGELKDYALGSYIANSMTHCEDCHTAPDRTPAFHLNTADYLLGGGVYDVPPPLQPVLRQVRSTSVNLKGRTNGFFSESGDSYARFKAIITTGTHADESPPRPLAFPMNLIAANLANLLEEDLASVYTYVKHAHTIGGPNDVERQPYARYCDTGADCAASEACAAGTHECTGRACAADVDCDTCQTCTAGACAAPLATSSCLANSR